MFVQLKYGYGSVETEVWEWRYESGDMGMEVWEWKYGSELSLSPYGTVELKSRTQLGLLHLIIKVHVSLFLSLNALSNTNFLALSTHLHPLTWYSTL